MHLKSFLMHLKSILLVVWQSQYALQVAQPKSVHFTHLGKHKDRMTDYAKDLKIFGKGYHFYMI